MVDGSNESLEHADQEYGPILREGITLQNSFEKVDVPKAVFISDPPTTVLKLFPLIIIHGDIVLDR